MQNLLTGQTAIITGATSGIGRATARLFAQEGAHIVACGRRAEALASLAGDDLNENNIIPKAFDPRVGPAVAKAVAEAARKCGVARI